MEGGHILANASHKTSRRKLDYYPTPDDVTYALMDFLNLDKCTIWEPACGDGTMSKVLIKYGHTVIASDIEKTGYGESGIDFLSEARNCDAIITNPPFAISQDMILHALHQANLVAMLLKSQYWHAKKRTPLFNQHPPTYVLPLNWRPDFMGGDRGGAPTMEVHWTVWIKGEYDTRYRILERAKTAKGGP